MEKSNNESSKKLASWYLAGIIGDLFGVFGGVCFFGILYRACILKDLDLLNVDRGYLVLYLLLFLIIVINVVKTATKNKLSRVTNNELDLEGKAVSDIYDELKCQIEKALKKSQVRTKDFIIFKGILNYGTMFGLGFLIVFFSKFNLFNEKPLLSLLVILFSVVSLFYSIVSLRDLKNRKLQGYTKKYRETVVLPILNRVDENLTFIFDVDELDGEINSRIVKQKFEESEIATEKYDTFLVDDVICDNTDNSYVSEITVEKRIGENPNKICFKGLFTEIKTSKKIEGKVKIGSNKIKNYSHDFTVPMNNKTFEKHFYVMAENNELAKNLLDEAFAQKIVAIYEMHDIPFEMVFKGEKVYIRLLTGEMFEPRLSGATINKKDIANCYYAINTIKELKEILK